MTFRWRAFRFTKAVDPSVVTGDARNPAAGRSAKNNLKLEETVKIRSVVTLVGLAISFALTTFAQQKDTADPRIVQQRDLLVGSKGTDEFNVLHQALDEAYKKNDAAAVAELFTEDAVLVAPDGMFSGRQEIEKRYAEVPAVAYCRL